jgi:hypothetical protein
MSQDELGRRIGLDRTMIAKIEVGTRRIDATGWTRRTRKGNGSQPDSPTQRCGHTDNI